MAVKQVNEPKQEPKQEVKQEIKQAAPKHVDVYTYDELVEAYKVFGVPKECVMAALKFNRITHSDVESAKVIINKFMRRVIV